MMPDMSTGRDVCPWQRFGTPSVEVTNMATEHTDVSYRQTRALRRMERELSCDRVLVQVAGLFAQPLPCRRPQPVHSGRRPARRPVLRLAVLAVVLGVLGLAGGVTGAIVGITWLTAASFLVVSAAGALMAWRGATAVQPAVVGARGN